MTPDQIAANLGRFQREGVPKYTALRDLIVDAVVKGRLKPGDRVPNESELASVLPISLGTIQRGLRQLVEEGVIQRRQGQGSFISGLRDDGEMPQPFHCRFLDDEGTGYLPVFPETLDRAPAGAGEWSRWLGAGEMLMIRRRIRIGDEFDVFSEFVVDPLRVPVFAKRPIKEFNSQNFKDVIFRASGQTVQKVDVFFSQRIPDARIAKALHMEARQSCLMLRAIGYLAEANPIYYQQIYIPPNARELHVVADNRTAGLLRG